MGRFESCIATYRARGDIFSYAIFEKTRSANKVSEMRKLSDSANEAYNGLELNTDMVDRVLAAFRANAYLAIRLKRRKPNTNVKYSDWNLPYTGTSMLF